MFLIITLFAFNSWCIILMYGTFLCGEKGDLYMNITDHDVNTVQFTTRLKFIIRLKVIIFVSDILFIVTKALFAGVLVMGLTYIYIRNQYMIPNSVFVWKLVNIFCFFFLKNFFQYSSCVSSTFLQRGVATGVPWGVSPQ